MKNTLKELQGFYNISLETITMLKVMPADENMCLLDTDDAIIER